MVDTGGRTGIALAGLFLIIIAMVCLYMIHQSHKPAPSVATSKPRRAAVPPPPTTREVPAATPDATTKTTTTAVASKADTTATKDVEKQEEAKVEEKDELPTGKTDATAPAATAAATTTASTTAAANDDKTEPAAAAPATTTTAAAAAETKAEPTAEELAQQEEDQKTKEMRKKLTNIPVPEDEEIQALFEEVDKNGDGKLTMAEVEKAIIQRKAQFNLKPTIVMRAFQKADTDNDGVISREEFFSFVRFITYFKNLSNVFDAMDVDKNRRLNKGEFLNAAKVLEIDEPETVFMEMDENQGGYIVFDEFCIWMAEKRHDENAF